MQPQKISATRVTDVTFAFTLLKRMSKKCQTQESAAARGKTAFF